MTVEFRCKVCGIMLRSPDDSEGKQARCSACGTILQVPPSVASPVSPSFVAPTAQTPDDSTAIPPGTNPFADAPQPATLAGPAVPLGSPEPMPPHAIRSKAIGPGIGLMVVSVVSMLFFALGAD